MLKAIEESQKEYFKLIQKYDKLFRDYSSSTINILYFFDEINIFWLKRLEIIEYELNYLTQGSQCFILSGAVYLNTKEHEHYYFKTFGDYHILHDPFLTMEGAVRYNDELHDKTFRYLCDIYEDTVGVLHDFGEEFFVLPVEKIAWMSNHDEKNELINKVFWQFVSSLFSKEINSIEEFQTYYDGFYSIEKDLDQNKLSNLIFTDSYDSRISIKERAERFINKNAHIMDLTKGKEETDIFISLLYMHIAQVMDILLTASKVGLIPFIRYEVPFRYLCLLMNCFTDKEDIMDVLKKTIIFYIFYMSVNSEDFKSMSFELYCNAIRKIKFLDLVLSRIRESKLCLMETETNTIKDIILEEYKRITALSY